MEYSLKAYRGWREVRLGVACQEEISFLTHRQYLLMTSVFPGKPSSRGIKRMARVFHL